MEAKICFPPLFPFPALIQKSEEIAKTLVPVSLQPGLGLVLLLQPSQTCQFTPISLCHPAVAVRCSLLQWGLCLHLPEVCKLEVTSASKLLVAFV